MTKTYKIIILLFSFIFLTTYTPKNLNITNKEKNNFFKIKKIEVTNNYKIKESIVFNRLNHLYNKNIIFLTNKDVLTYLLDLDYLERIEIKKKYPDTIVIKISETEPLAILYRENKKYVLDSLSNLIVLEESLNEKKLPKVFGLKAENDFINFFNQLTSNKFPKNRIKSYTYFQINRWDLKLVNDQIIKFPAEKRKEAIQQSVELLEREDFKKYKVIDLRIDGKIVVE
jgi:cell division septal protein FtsQ